jgi:hypothetical protein
MPYTKSGRVVAGILLVIGISSVAIGLGVAAGIIVEPEPGRYLVSKTSGEAIDRGLYYVFIAICLGVLTDISKSVTKNEASAE